MRTAMLAAVSGPLVLALAGTANAACSNRTIRGDYAFTVQGNALSDDGTRVVGLINGVGIISFDGSGNLAQQDYVLINTQQIPGGASNPSGFHTDQTGTYKINADCTGDAVIRTGPGNELNLALVVSNGGNSFHTVVTSALVNGSPVKFQTRSDAERITPREMRE
jgi:hypothetical protein